MILLALTMLGILAATVWVAAPLIRKQASFPAGPVDDRLSDLLEAKEAVYRSILDLEFDRKMDKVAEEDYVIMRAQHETEALKILEEMDDPAWSPDALEKEIAAARERLRK